jgi:hypothetical protein
MRNVTIIVPESKEDIIKIGNDVKTKCVMTGKRVINSKEVKSVQLIAENFFNSMRIKAATSLEKLADNININTVPTIKG